MSARRHYSYCASLDPAPAECDCSYDEDHRPTIMVLRNELAQVKAERDRLRDAFSKDDDAICQVLGKSLGYPWYKDDPKNFPDARADDGVCVGEHVAASIAMEAAAALTAERERIARLEGVIRAHNDGCQQSCDERAKGAHCNRYHGYERWCSDCPRDWAIDDAALSPSTPKEPT